MELSEEKRNEIKKTENARFVCSHRVTVFIIYLTITRRRQGDNIH